ncbi:MAG: HAD hydrolase-like protein [Solirubrobacteraceae bacterium]
MALLLWDIDGTLLLGASLAHHAAICAALAQTYGIADPARLEVVAAGRTDDSIARELLALSGVADPGERFAVFRQRCFELYAELAPASLRELVAPGIPQLLDPAGGHRHSLVTGNYEPIARLKLERAGLAQSFAPGQGGFGSDAEERALLPEIARRRAGGHPREDTILIGDTPRDIACARADGLRVFAVATGPYSADELADADAVAASAWELADLLL